MTLHRSGPWPIWNGWTSSPRCLKKSWVPPAVIGELRNPRGDGAPVFAERYPQLLVKTPKDSIEVERFAVDLDAGESESLALAIELGITDVLVDDRRARVAATRAGLKPTGVFGVLAMAKKAGLVEAVMPFMERLKRGIRFFVSEELEAEVRRMAEE